ncbi:thioredoxin domain-containing protein 3 isoform X2 [Empidonax traillii]|uniref:thioredoxin domain-containing protein 3 isoform X2 n=1 Tax=Empidonax traillii TaxID=164674 RepID=UPI000FFCF6B7|nr:thioredoxin domain-containing protein 3 isoform X2 [Empidonax traillii]
MASKKKEVPLQIIITSQDQWDEMLQTNGIVVIDVYQAWCGPCKAVLNVLRKLKNDFSEDNVLYFAVAEADSIETLKPFRNNCEPVFLFCVYGKIIDIVRGVNAPLIIKKVTNLVEEERQIAAGEKERTEVDELVFLEEKSSEETIEETADEEEILRYSVGIIKPNDVLEGRVEEIKQKIREAGFDIKAAEEKVLTEEQIRVFYARNKEQPNFEEFVQFMMSGPCHVLVFTRKEDTDAIPHWKELHGTHDSESEKPESGHALAEAESLVNLCDVQDSVEDASRQLGFFFPNFHIHKTDQQVEKTLAIIRPKLLKERRNSIMQRIKDDGFKIAMQKEIVLSEEQVRTFYSEHVNEDYFPVLLEQMTSGPTLVLALTRENAVAHWRSLLGPKTLEEACKENPDSLRAQYAVDNVPINQLHGSSTPDDAQKELEFFFPQEQTFALIKPEAAKTHKDDIMKKVKEAGFSISKIKEQALTREMAAQFYKDHEGKPFYEQLVSCMTEGPSVIMVLSKENAVEEWRKLMGPTDPEEAKKTCPESIRAQFAHDILSNAVHGSSNREHALKSIQFAFGEIDTN